MAWTSPKTWSASEVPTAALFNQQVRDNLGVIRASRDATGKLAALDSTSVADLYGDLLTGLVSLGRRNTHATGKQDFSAGSTRVVLPAGKSLYAGGLRMRRGRGKWVAMECKEPGSAWVQGGYFHHVGPTKVEWRQLGIILSTPVNPLAGSTWVEPGIDNLLHFIAKDGFNERTYEAVTTGGHLDAAAIPGSIWVDTDDRVHWIGAGGQEYIGHADIAAHFDVGHSDAHTNAHTDTHSNIAHSDTHTDAGHGDTHSNTHTDTHSDTHTDMAHADAHTNTHTDTHSNFLDHADNHNDHCDEIHGDEHFDESPHNDTHSDAHTNTHTDTGHNDTHSNTHSDIGHSDTHTNTAHQDSHTNTAHSDTHSDVAHADTHSNVAHVDHADVHADRPERVGTKGP